MKLFSTKSAEKALKTRFKNPRLLAAALAHPSYRNGTPCPKLEDFDRLEFFGDSVLNFVICKKLYKLFPKADEGMLSKLRSILVSRKILARIAKEIHLTRILKVSKGLRQEKEFLKAKLVTDAMESLFGAIFFDRGLPAAEKFILKHFKSYFDAKRLFRLDPNPKSSLQELVQKLWQQLPQYTTEITPKGVKITISVGKLYRVTAVARSRREGEEKAARTLLLKIRQESRRSKGRASGKKLRKTR